MSHASLCFLSFNRPQFIFEAIKSAKDNAGWPCEIIVHDDGSSDLTTEALRDLVSRGEISSLILNPEGHNEGVGRALNRAASLSTGQWIVKLDQDLLFKPDWLRKVVEIHLADPTVCGVGLFKYYVDPCNWEKMYIEPGCPSGAPPTVPYHYCKDFVSSAISMPRHAWRVKPWPEHSAAYAEDVEWKIGRMAEGARLAMPDEDLATNRGFGIGPSTVVTAPGTVQAIHDQPVIFNA